MNEVLLYYIHSSPNKRRNFVLCHFIQHQVETGGWRSAFPPALFSETRTPGGGWPSLRGQGEKRHVGGRQLGLCDLFVVCRECGPTVCLGARGGGVVGEWPNWKRQG